MPNDPSTGGSRLSRRDVLASGAAGLAALAGCIAHGEDSGLRGEIIMDGSNTVLPHGAAVAEEFLWRNNQVEIPVRGSGTGAGFERFCEGTTHIQNASRPILPEEEDHCAENGVDYIELEALKDGIAIVVHPDNDWCDCLTVEELKRIWEPGGVDTWGELRDDWPDEEIVLFGRDPGSGTFDTFTERVVGEIGLVRDDYSATSDNNVVVRGVSGDQYALGYTGAGYYYENEDDLKLVGVDNGDGCVQPNRESVESGTYQPLTRSMFVYINTAELEREVMRAFARFYFESIDEETHEEAVESGIADPDEELAWTQWAARQVGYYAAADEVVAESHSELEAEIEART